MSSFMKEFDHLRIYLEVIKQVTNNFGDDHYIGKGAFGKVYKAEFQSVVAVKRLDRAYGQGDVEFWKEIMLLSCYRHENLISLVGFCDESEEKILVYEYAPNKSLDLHLRSTNLTWVQRLKICLGAARGLQYLHDPKGGQQRVLHRDIKSANILLDENWNAKIGDFGLSKFGPANQQYTFLVSNVVGTMGYIDPMYIETMLLTKESDVYSFGVVLFEVLCSRPCVELSLDGPHRVLPILAKKYYQEQILDTIMDGNIRQQIKPACFDIFTAIAYQCLQRDREKRPSMDLIVHKLETALEHQVGSITYGLDDHQMRLRFIWTPQAHNKFVNVVAQLGIENAVPETIIQLMSVDGLTPEDVASHLKKYKLYLKRMKGLLPSPGSGSLDQSPVNLELSLKMWKYGKKYFVC